MPIPVDTDGPGWRIIAIGAGSLLTGLFSWVASNLRAEHKELREELKGHIDRVDDELKEHVIRVEALERTYVTREELKDNILRLEAVVQRKYDQQIAYLQRIENKIEKGGETRHDIRDGMGAAQLMLRAILAEVKKDPGPTP